MAILAWFWLPQGPGSAWFLNPEEQVFTTQRIIKDNASYVAHEYDTDGMERDRLTKRDALETAKDWKFWFLLVFNICASVPSQAFSVFLPMVIQGLGYSSINANLVRFLCFRPDSLLKLRQSFVDVGTPLRICRYGPISLCTF
jgi:hypothetical protein